MLSGDAEPGSSPLGSALVALALTALVMALTVPLGPFPLAVPFAYSGNAIQLAAFLKAVAEEGPMRAVGIAAPSGTAFGDWPVASALALFGLGPLARLTGEPGLVLNAAWLAGTLLGGATAAWALRRLGVARVAAVGFGVAYALCPGALYRNVGEIGLSRALLPLLALAALRLTGVPAGPSRLERVALPAASLLLGLVSADDGLLAGCVLLVAVAAGLAVRPRGEALRLAAPVLLLLALGCAASLVPRLVAEREAGRNPRLEARLSVIADPQGVRLREMLLPIDEHPLAPLRALAARFDRARFPGESRSLRLGTFASLGLVLLLAYALARAGGVLPPHRELGPAALLVLTVLLLAGSGGIASLSSGRLLRDGDAFGRTASLVGFLSLLALALVFAAALQRLRAATDLWPGWPAWDARPSWARGAVSAAAMLLLATAVAFDQVPTRFLGATRWSTAPAFGQDAAFVAALERELPPDAMVFQLPHAALPLGTLADGPDPRSQGRGRLHSHRLRWSWGSVLGRDGDWALDVARLDPTAMVGRLAQAGFSGVWIDTGGRGSAPGEPTLEAQLAAAAGTTPRSGAGSRLVFVPLRPPATSSASALQAITVPARWIAGCSEEHGPASSASRVCGASGVVRIEGLRTGTDRVRLDASLRALRPGRLAVEAGALSDELTLAGAPLPYRREVPMPSQGPLEVRLRFEGPCEATSPRARCLEILSFEATPVAGGAP